ncbi:MAG: hypothetical protein JO314_12470, partial [Acidobacteria bacterium]|nr:hypothetical protein [Acidobacteriota bacterium]
MKKQLLFWGFVSIAVVVGFLVHRDDVSAQRARSGTRSISPNSPASAFAAGDLVVYRVGDGSAALSSAAAPVFLDEYTPAGVFVQTIAMPTAVNGSNKRLVAAGSSTAEGLMTRSVDGNYLVLTGYDAAVGTTTVASSSAATTNRVVARVSAAGVVDTSTALTDAISGSSSTAANIRGASSTNGTDIWVSGTAAGGGIRYATLGATTSTQVSAGPPTNIRATEIFSNQLYISS